MNTTPLSVSPGCEFFKDYKDGDYTAEGLVFNWNQVLCLTHTHTQSLRFLISIHPDELFSGLVLTMRLEVRTTDVGSGPPCPFILFIVISKTKLNLGEHCYTLYE
jgi:16S rRNA G527 N7-methylase RsmG